MSTVENEKASLCKAKAVVYQLFKFRPRSEHEIITKLKEKNFESGIIEQVVSFFKKCGLIDDQVFAKSWVASRLNKPIGLRRIQEELKVKGIAAEIIALQLSAAKSGYDESAAIKEIIKRRARIYQELDPIKKRRRLEGYLLRRGFSTETVYKILKRPGGP